MTKKAVKNAAINVVAFTGACGLTAGVYGAMCYHGAKQAVRRRISRTGR